MSKVDRRKFIKSSMAVAAAGAALLQGCETVRKTVSPPTTLRPIGANEDVRIALIGLGRQGRGSHLRAFRKIEGLRIVALCDADTQRLDEMANEFRNSGESIYANKDFRKILERNDVDAVSIVTPNFWHSLMTVWACQAGKHVYVEKPVSQTIWEGRQSVRAGRKYKRLVQAGIQSRSSPNITATIQALRDGELGKIKIVRGLCYKPRNSIGKVKGPQVIPAGVDYDLWTGPTALKPLMRENLHYDWHWDYETGNGDIGNQGPHEMDKARRVNGSPLAARRVISIGGRFGYDDDANTANTQIAYYDFGPEHAPILFEVRGLPMRTGMTDMGPYRGVRIGNIVDCENGYFAGGGGGWLYDNEGEKIRQVKAEGEGNHWLNFVNAVRSGKQSDVTADIEDGHISATLSHMGNISYRLGEKLPPAEIKKRISDIPELVDAFDRMLEHLVANDVDISKDHATLGPWLDFDPVREAFTGPSEWTLLANAMARRNDREPYVIPEGKRL